MNHTGFSFPCRLLGTILVCMAIPLPKQADAATCLWVSSYHPGYEWEDGIGRGLEAVLKGKCEIHRFAMDTKRLPEAGHGYSKGREALALVQSLNPDVIIASDDNASRYFVAPHLKDKGVPVVFCGINWTVADYGYPYKNATGMIELAPVKPLIEEINRAIKNPSRGLYLSSDVSTEHTDATWFQRIFAKEGISVDTRFVRTIEEWEQGYLYGQEYDFLVLGNNAGINDWDEERAGRFALTHAGKLTVTNYDWMMPYTMLAKTKIPEEQGEWAGNVALEILGGMDPAAIPIVPNRRWNLFANPALLEKAGIRLGPGFLIGAIKVRP